MVELACIVAVVILACAQGWQHSKAHGCFQVERDQWHKERASLLNRIKPETAQPIPGEPVVEVPATRWDSDEDYWESRKAVVSGG